MLGRQPCWVSGDVGRAIICAVGHVGQAAMLDGQPCWTGSHVGQAAMLDGQPCWMGGHIGWAAIFDGQCVSRLPIIPL